MTRFRSASPLWPILFLLASVLHAHPQPATLVMFDVGEQTVSAELHVPLPELELAFGHNVTKEPLSAWEDAFGQYLRAHFRPATPAGDAWAVRVASIALAKAEQDQTGPYREAIVQLALRPPAGGALRDFVLHHDLILHQVVTHKALVSVRTNWKAGQVEPAPARTIFVDTANGQIAPLRIEAEPGGWFRGFRALVALGAQHIREGIDHLLFLLVLLLPATLRVAPGRWSSYAGHGESLRRIVGIVTAFTLGHSVTLMAGALQWVKLPSQPVEVLIAGSVLLTAIHAWRPIFPGRESQVAALFGLVHGLAFATVLADLRVDGAAMALSILGFNLGIELMQLFVIALTLPWLMVLSLTPAHRFVRLSGALAAAVVACGWIASRVTDQSNWIERAAGVAAEFAPAGIVMLALIAIPAYWRFTGTISPIEGNQ